jgi:hypothetical protein
MALKERMRARLESLRGQVKLLTELLAEEDDTPKTPRKYKKRAKKPKNAKLPKVKRTPLLGEVDDIEDQLKTQQAMERTPFEMHELFGVINSFKGKGCLLQQIFVEVNNRRTPTNQLEKSGPISTMLVRVHRHKKFHSWIKRKSVKPKKGSKALYRYYYTGPKIHSPEYADSFYR